MQKILIVDDNQSWQRGARRLLSDVVEPLAAFNFKDAYRIFGERADLSLIAVDGRLESNELDTMQLVHFFRERFAGPIVSIASDETDRSHMLEEGCSMACQKDEFIRVVHLIFRSEKSAGAST